MGQLVRLYAAEPRRLPGFGLAVLLSAALHGLIALSLWTLLGLRTPSATDQPLGEVLVSVSEGDWTLTLAPASPPVPPSAAASTTDEAEEQELPIRVEPLVPSAVSSSDAGEAPHVQGVSQPVRRQRARDGPANGAAHPAPTFFDVPIRACRIVFIIDRSTSMWANGGLEAAKRELLALLKQLPAEARFQVLFYNNSVEMLPGAERDGYLRVAEQTRREAAQFVERLRPAGSTNHLGALRRALALKPDEIFLVTDGEDLRLDQVRELSDLNHGRAIIHALQWGRTQRADGPLMVLANWNRGTYRSLSGTPGELK
jgi:hypothetical protein